MFALVGFPQIILPCQVWYSGKEGGEPIQIVRRKKSRHLGGGVGESEVRTS